MPALASSTAQLLAFPGPAIALRAALSSQLRRHRLPEHLIEAFIRDAAARPVCGIDEALAQVLAARMRPVVLGSRRPVFLIGPTGAGVTSIAEKLRYRAKARGRAIRIESRSFNPGNMRARTAFGSAGERPGVETIGVVSALADAEELGEIISAFRLSRVIVTGLDMARRFGALAAAVTQGAGLVAVTRSPKAAAPLETLSPGELAAMLLS